MEHILNLYNEESMVITEKLRKGKIPVLEINFGYSE